MSVSDNGRGMPQQAVAGGHHGLAGMRHRVAALGGDLTIRPHERGGTQIVVRVPLRRVLAELVEEGGDVGHAAARASPVPQRG